MKNLLNLIILTCITLFGFTNGHNNLANKKKPVYEIKTVVLDAGHGGHDNGCSGKSSYEKHVALSIVLKLGKYLKKEFPGLKVIYTRDKDIFVPLNERASIANRNDADIFISVHCNAAANRSASGTETFVMGLHKNDANLKVAQRENEVILLEDNYNEIYEYDPNNPLSHILFSVYQNAFMDQSIHLANKIQEQFTERSKRKNRGVKQAGFVVLYKTAMPSVLVESGFLTNHPEEEFLRSEYGQEIIASAIFRAFRDYKQELEEDSNGLGNSIASRTEGYDKNGKPGKLPQKKAPENLIVSEGTQSEDPLKQVEQVLESSSNTETDKEGIDETQIEFRIQIFATGKKANVVNHSFSGLNPVYHEKSQKGLYRYFYGRFSSSTETKSALKEAKSAGFSDAFIVAYKDGQRIDNPDFIATSEQE